MVRNQFVSPTGGHTIGGHRVRNTPHVFSLSGVLVGWTRRASRIECRIPLTIDAPMIKKNRCCIIVVMSLESVGLYKNKNPKKNGWKISLWSNGMHSLELRPQMYTIAVHLVTVNKQAVTLFGRTPLSSPFRDRAPIVSVAFGTLPSVPKGLPIHLVPLPTILKYSRMFCKVK